MENNDNISNISTTENRSYCHSCGFPIKTGTDICPQCGAKQHNQNTILPNGKSKIAAGLFAILLGGIGVHKFYMRQIGKGILYILFCWTGIPSLLALIEGICILVEDDTRFLNRLQ